MRNFGGSLLELDRQLKTVKNIKNSIPIAVKRFFTDVDGNVITNLALIPSSLQVAYPIFLLGSFDKSGGYQIANERTPSLGGSKYLFTYTQGVGVPFLQFSGNNTINSRLQIGDIVTVYTDNILNPNYFIFIVQTNSFTSLSSFVENLKTTQEDNKTGKSDLININFITDNQNQYNDSWLLITTDNIGRSRSDAITPNVFKNQNTRQQDFLTLQINRKLDQFFGISLYYLYPTTNISLTLNINN